MIKRIIKLILIILWMGLIFSFSSDTGDVSTKKSDGFIIKSVETILGRELSESEKEKWTTYLVVPVRKGAHIGVYLVLGCLVFSLCREFMQLDYKIILVSIIVSLLYACSDEVHQLFVVGRSGQLKDVVLDTFGASLGVFSHYFISWKLSSKYDKK